MIALYIALNFNIWPQNVTKADIEGYDLTRAVYNKRTEDFGIPKQQLSKLLKSLYGLTEPADAWFHTYKKVLTQTLKLQLTNFIFISTAEEKWLDP